VSVIVALLSAVNVGGRQAPSAALKAICAQLGWKRAETRLASGNIIADIGRASAATAAVKLEEAIAAAFGFDSAVIVRTADDLDGVIARQPFKTFEPKLLQTHFMAAAPTRSHIAALDAFNKGREDYVIDGRELFIRYQSRVAQSRLTAPVLRRLLGTAGTARNWNTVNKLRDAARTMERG
jgi:uncharacterized protein (DUF1697 family)